LTRTFTPRHLRVLVDFILSKRVRQSLVRTSYPWRDKRFSRTLPPTFLFLQYSIVKEQTSQTRGRGPLRFWLRGRPSVAYAALLNSHKGVSRSKLLRRLRRTALVREAYIVATNPNCQHRSRMFLNFLRQKFWSPRTAPGEHRRRQKGALLPPHCRSTPRPTRKAPARPARRLPIRDQSGVCAPSVRPLIRA
jgi:hypothetical protein